jgi:hypothetical protein
VRGSDEPVRRRCGLVLVRGKVDAIPDRHHASRELLLWRRRVGGVPAEDHEEVERVCVDRSEQRFHRQRWRARHDRLDVADGGPRQEGRQEIGKSVNHRWLGSAGDHDCVISMREKVSRDAVNPLAYALRRELALRPLIPERERPRRGRVMTHNHGTEEGICDARNVASSDRQTVVGDGPGRGPRGFSDVHPSAIGPATPPSVCMLACVPEVKGPIGQDVCV